MWCHYVFNFKFIDVTSWVGWIKRTDGRSDGHAYRLSSWCQLYPPYPTPLHPNDDQVRKDGRLEWHLTSHFSVHERRKEKKRRKKRMTEAQKEYDENQMWLRSIYCQSLSYVTDQIWKKDRNRGLRYGSGGRGEGLKFKGIYFYEGGSLYQALS